MPGPTIARIPLRLVCLAVAVTAGATPAGMMSGCGRQVPDGPPRYALSGKVTFDGKPVPTGMIRFSPNREQGNRGPAAIADIRNGEYRTLNGKGIVGGPMIIEINGSDGIPVNMDGETIPSGTVLFESYRIQMNLPNQNANQNFDIPKTPPQKK